MRRPASARVCPRRPTKSPLGISTRHGGYGTHTHLHTHTHICIKISLKVCIYIYYIVRGRVSPYADCFFITFRVPATRATHDLISDTI